MHLLYQAETHGSEVKDGEAPHAVRPEWPKQSFGAYMRELRVSRGLKMRGVALKTGITQGYISQIENDCCMPSIRVLLSLAEVYNADPWQVLSRSGALETKHSHCCPLCGNG